jgi:hypothetical protein
VVVVRVAVHQHDSGLVTRLLERVDPVRAALDGGYRESRHDHTDAGHGPHSSEIARICPGVGSRRGVTSRTAAAMSQVELDADHVRWAAHRGQAIVNANDRAREARAPAAERRGS